MSDGVLVFIDGPNLFNELKRLDILSKLSDASQFEKLVEKLCIGMSYQGTYYYNAETPPNKIFAKQKQLYEDLKRLRGFYFRGSRILERRKRCTKCNQDYTFDQEKGLDVKLSTDMLCFAFLNKYDVGILIGGDQDYIPLVQAISEKTGKKIVNAFFKREDPKTGKMSPPLLATECFDFTDIKEILDTF